jgi:hypothetical protein
MLTYYEEPFRLPRLPGVYLQTGCILLLSDSMKAAEASKIARTDGLAKHSLSPLLKYSNWLVAAILFVVGARALFVISRALFISRSLSTERLTVSLFQAIIATLFVIAAFGTVRWDAWGRSLAIPVCAWNAFATIFLTRLPTNARLAGLIFCATLVLLIIWFHLPKVKLQFITAKGQLAPPVD